MARCIVTTMTRGAMMAFFGAVSFQDGSGSAAKAAFVSASRKEQGLHKQGFHGDAPSDTRMTGRFRHKRPAMTVLFCRRGFLQLRKHFIHVEAGRLLPLRVVLKRHQELAHVSLCGHKLEGVIKKPVIIGV